MEVEQEEAFILSNNGEIRGRKNLVKEIANSSFSDHICLPNIQKTANKHNVKLNETKAKNVDSQTASNGSSYYVKANDSNLKSQEFVPNRKKPNFIVNAELAPMEPNREKLGNIKPKTFYFSSILSTDNQKNETCNIVNKNGKYFPRPNLETFSDHDSVDFANVYRNGLPEQESTDFGYSNYIKQVEELNENKRDIWKSQKPHSFYSCNNGSSNSNKQFHEDLNFKNIFYTNKRRTDESIERETYLNQINDNTKFDLPQNDNLMTDKYGSSRNSSVRSFNKMLPVGTFAKQKFHVVQDEEELLGRPVIYDLNGLPIPNLEITNEFDCVSESVSINISKLTNVEVVVTILVSKYISKKQIDKPWTKKTIEIIRTISINVEASGKKEKVEKLINDLMKNKSEKFDIKASIYRLKGEKIQLTGYSALKVFKTLMKIAESWKTENHKNFGKNYNFTPLYLLAVLKDPNSPYFPYH